MQSRHDDKSQRHWEHRQEKNWQRYTFNQPYAKGLRRLNEILDKTNFDPATLWQWGTMQAMALIEILKTMERTFGKKGQQAVFESLHRVGYDIGKQVTQGITLPDGISDAEWISFFATVINRIVYASLETPVIESDQRVSFHIDWCPHQDAYRPFDCRVQRYFVQGMLDAAMEFLRSQGREDVWDVVFRTTIPSGSETCHFEIYRGNPQEARQWSEYTRLLETKALEIAAIDDESIKKS
jgi:hypothetical protein